MTCLPPVKEALPITIGLDKHASLIQAPCVLLLMIVQAGEVIVHFAPYAPWVSVQTIHSLVGEPVGYCVGANEVGKLVGTFVGAGEVGTFVGDREVGVFVGTFVGDREVGAKEVGGLVGVFVGEREVGDCVG